MSPPRITCHFYAPVPGDYDPRVLGVVAAIEAALPGVHLDHEVTASGTARQLPDRDDALREASSRRQFPFVFHADEDRYVGIRGREIPGTMMPGHIAAWELWASLPLSEPADHLAQAIGEIGRASSSHWGSASPDAAAAIIAQQTVHPGLARPVPLGLPGLLLPARLSDAFVPHRLGWINYWSKTTCELLDFPDHARDHELLTRAHAVGDSWVVRLTDDPLDLSRADHLSALRAAYVRFARVGR